MAELAHEQLDPKALQQRLTHTCREAQGIGSAGKQQGIGSAVRSAVGELRRLTPAMMLHLQRTVGNRTVAGLLSSRTRPAPTTPVQQRWQCVGTCGGCGGEGTMMASEEAVIDAAAIQRLPDGGDLAIQRWQWVWEEEEGGAGGAPPQREPTGSEGGAGGAPPEPEGGYTPARGDDRQQGADGAGGGESERSDGQGGASVDSGTGSSQALVPPPIPPSAGLMRNILSGTSAVRGAAVAAEAETALAAGEGLVTSAAPVASAGATVEVTTMAPTVLAAGWIILAVLVLGGVTYYVIKTSGGGYPKWAHGGTDGPASADTDDANAEVADQDGDPGPLADDQATCESLTQAQKRHQHHVFPQEYRIEFAELDIEVDEFTISVKAADHIRAHGRSDWNGEWEDFFSRVPDRTLTPAEKTKWQEKALQLLADLLDRMNWSHLKIRPYWPNKK
jgi:hypothetical protein